MCIVISFVICNEWQGFQIQSTEIILLNHLAILNMTVHWFYTFYSLTAANILK